MKRLSLAVAAAAFALPAHATGTIECSATNGASVSAFLLIGRLPVLNVLQATFEADGSVWSTGTNGDIATIPPGSTPVRFGQGIQTDDRVIADFTDPNVEEVVVSLRLFRAFEDKGGAEAGILHIHGTGVWPVSCENG